MSEALGVTLVITPGLLEFYLEFADRPLDVDPFLGKVLDLHADEQASRRRGLVGDQGRHIFRQQLFNGF